MANEPMPLNIADMQTWVLERLENTYRIANTKTGSDQSDWREDARYYRAILMSLEKLRLINESGKG
jgi:hypothetical protein